MSARRPQHDTASSGKKASMMTEKVDKLQEKIQSLIDKKKGFINACSDNLIKIAKDKAKYEIKLVHGTVSNTETDIMETREKRKIELARHLDDHALDLVTLESVNKFLMREDFRQAFALGKSTDRSRREEHLVEIYDAINDGVERCITRQE